MQIVVNLPEPTGPDEDGQVFFGDYDIRVDNTGRSDAPGDIWTDFGLGRDVLRRFNPATARRIATELLAAAHYAESKVHTCSFDDYGSDSSCQPCSLT